MALAEVLDGIDLDADLSALSDDELSARALALTDLAARVESARLAALAAVDVRQPWAADGDRSTAAWIAHQRRLPVGACRADVYRARNLRRLPRLAEAFATAEVSLHHVRLLERLLQNRTIADALADGGEELLVGHARTLPFRDFARVAGYFGQVADPDGTERSADEQHERRRLHLSQLPDGSWRLDGQLDPLAGTEVDTALERIEQELFDADRTDGSLRRPAQRRADALVELARRATSTPPGARRPEPLITVLVDHETFGSRICELADGTLLAPGQVASLLDRALIERIVFAGASRVLDLGRARSFTGALRRALEVRDRHCSFPGCDVPAHRCQDMRGSARLVGARLGARRSRPGRRNGRRHLATGPRMSWGDHIIEWSHGGRTIQINGRLDCGDHNRWRYRHRRRNTDDVGWRTTRVTLDRSPP